MNIGMLWFDNDPKTDFSLKIERAVRYYREKYGSKPNVCFVHPSMLVSKAENSPLSGDIEVRATKSVLPNHFWIGINGTTPASSS